MTKIRAKTDPSYVFEAHPDAAKELIAAGIYEAADESQEKREPVKPLTTDTGPGVKTKPAKRGKAK